MSLPKLELFYSPLCPTCPKAKEIAREVVEEEEVEEYEEINILSPDGGEKAAKYGIKSVPALVVNEGEPIFGIPLKEGLVRLIKEVKV
ncbi:thioredoxin family protein [bacterium]|nr:thioredoxin family protein [bacterium]